MTLLNSLTHKAGKKQFSVTIFFTLTLLGLNVL